MSNAQVRVQRGVKWLDANYPGWRNVVEINQFDITNVCNCILGQLFSTISTSNGFDYVLDEKILSYDQCVSLGFDATADAGDWSELQAAWEEELLRTTIMV